MSHWGIDPLDDPGKRSISIAEVAHLRSSPVRLAADLASRLYAAGESGMGGMIFTLVARDGRRLAFVGGNAIDFPVWPADLDPADIVDVLPHVGRNTATGSLASYTWCLYSA